MTKQIFKFRKPQTNDERNERFELIEDRGDRMLLVDREKTYLTGTFVYLKSDMVEVTQPDPLFKRLTSDQFYKMLNKFYSSIKHYNKDVIYDYALLNELERPIKTQKNIWTYDNVYNESTFNIAIFARTTGTHVFNYCNPSHDNQFYQSLKLNNDKILIVQKCLGKYEEPFYIVKSYKLN
jgi:hypothetical protein